ncbi:MAG TPA: hypothetical protein PK079_09670 [Leptospiraceae bacterium]|nr:hypothetical protein [Leptospiraceae bacterium]HMW04574.1 hypothetical protein [Leptospiraceae bacterium]HMX33273.1 hypothetical protein [Leptospiraceae bacterium]HNB96677.1 hypothetical protein [Leptospiraceae bacterium]HNE08859.1 hypothetical protein [Leptospiraceae bacterium]
MEIKTSGVNKTDVVKIKVDRIFFFLNPFSLFAGRLSIYQFRIKNLDVKYINHIPSIEKIKYMPREGKAIIHSGYITNGNIEIEDMSVFPIYKTDIRNIEIADALIDLGNPFQLIFNSEYAYCKIDKGDVISTCKNGTGQLQVKGVTWGKLINLDILPIGFLQNKIDLNLNFTHTESITRFNGTLGQINRKPQKQNQSDRKQKLEYEFQADWKEYRLPFDLALKKMVYQLLIGMNYGGAFTIVIEVIAKKFAKLLKGNTQTKNNDIILDSSN